MSIENITIEQKRLVLAGLLLLHRSNQLEDCDIEAVPERSVQDFLLLAKNLRFYSLDFDFDHYCFIYDFDYGDLRIMKEPDEIVNELFDKYNCFEYIKFMDFLNIFYQITLLTNNSGLAMLKGSLIQDSRPIVDAKELFLTAIKDNKINDDYLLLFRELAYLGLKKEQKKAELLRIEKTRAVRNKNIATRNEREGVIFEFIMKKDIIELSQFINQGKKYCINTIVELDYNFCKENDLGVYRESLEHLKATNKNNLSRSTAGRKWLGFFRHVIFNTILSEFGLGLLHTNIREETRNAYNLIFESWLKST